MRQNSIAKGSSTADPAEVQRLLPVGMDTFDHLATMVVVVEPDGQCLFINAAFEEMLGVSRRSVLRESIFDWFVDPTVLSDIVAAVAANDFSTSRLEAELKRHPHLFPDPLHVQAIVTRLKHGGLVIIELVEVEQKTRQEREERALEVATGRSAGDDEATVSLAEAGIAETGTLMFVSGAANPTTLNFLPEHHIVVVDAAAIDGDLETALARIRAGYGKGTMPRTVNFVTGPSRSGDIEQTMLLGAHGPRALHIVVVDG